MNLTIELERKLKMNNGKLVMSSPTKERLELQIRKFFYVHDNVRIRFLDNGKIQRVKNEIWKDYLGYEWAKVSNRFCMYNANKQ